MLHRLAYLGVTNTLTLLRLLPMSERHKDAEILALRHQIAALERQLHGEKIRFTRADRAWLTALLHQLPRDYTSSPATSSVSANVAASTVWEILKDTGIDPTPKRTSTTRTTFLHSQADAILAADFFKTTMLTNAKAYVLAVIQHTTRRVRILSATAHPTPTWVTQPARNLIMDLDDAGRQVKYLIRDRDRKFPTLSTRSSPTPASRSYSAASGYPE